MAMIDETTTMAVFFQTFAEHHHCADPKPSGGVNMWGGIECLTCGFEVIVDNHLAPLYRSTE